MENKLVSVVVPVYNAEKFLKLCVQSILDQTYKNLEVILVDDGSTDNSSTICDDIQRNDSRVKVIHKENEGAGLSRNRGIEIASGDFILFVDSDDCIKLDLIEKCVNKADGNDSTIVMFGIQNINEMGSVIKENVPYSDKYIFKGREVQEELLPQILFADEKKYRNLELPACMANFYSMNVIRRTGWKFKSEREFISEDLYSIIGLYKFINKVVVINEPLYCYRYCHESLSHSSRLMNYEMIRNFYEQCIILCKDNNYNSRVLRNISEPYLSFTIACIKFIAIQKNKSLFEKRKELNEVLKDEQLYNVLKERNLNNENMNKRILYKSILTRKYCFARFLILIQAYRKWR